MFCKFRAELEIIVASVFRKCFQYKNDRRLTISLILIDSSEEDDEDNEEEKEKICENATDYVESYVQTNQVDVDERFTNHLKARLKNQPAFLHRYIYRDFHQHEYWFQCISVFSNLT